METRETEIVKPRKVGVTAVVDGADCRFVRIKNNLFRVAAIKSVRIEGVSLKVFLVEEMYARVTFETAEKARACWESLTREMCASRRRGREESEVPGTDDPSEKDFTKSDAVNEGTGKRGRWERLKYAIFKK